jgi:hypothetical protein
MVAKKLLLLAIATISLESVGGCSLGAKSLLHTQIRTNDAVKSTSEQQLSLHIEERTEVLRHPGDAASMSTTESVECIQSEIAIDLAHPDSATLASSVNLFFVRS